MAGTILVYGNESMLVMTRAVILKRAGYQVVTATQFPAAVSAVMNKKINLLLLCQTLGNDERRAIWETAREVMPDVKCMILSYRGQSVPVWDAEVVEGLDGPTTLLKSIEKLLAQDERAQTAAPVG